MIAVGSILAGYRLDAVLGHGAASTVFAATELAGARRVALRLLAPRRHANPAVRERFRQAALIQQGLEHPDVLDVIDIVESGDDIFLVLPLVGGGTLADLIARGTLTGERTFRLLGQVADALDFAHGCGVAHGDVKPRNVLVEDDHAYLTDFGLAIALSQVELGAGAAPGTIDYSAPERLRGEPPSSSADVYSFACLFFECLTGAVPFPRDTPAAVVGGHLFNAPPRASELRSELPAALDEILAHGLAKDPADRPRSARELIDSAGAVLEQVGPMIVEAPQPGEQASAGRREGDTLVDPLPVLPVAPVIEPDEPLGLSRRALVVAAVVLAVFAALGAWLGQRSPGRAGDRPLGRGGLVLTVPAEWRRAAPRALAELTLAAPLALVPRERPRAVTLAIGWVTADPPTFLPDAFLEGMRKPPRRVLVQLDGGVAYKYAGVGRQLAIYVLPGPGRSAVAACTALRASGPWLDECESVAKTLRVRRGLVYDPTPSRRFDAAYNAAMRVLRVARGSGLALLGKATSRRAQARAATGIAVAYRTTAASMRRANPPPIALDALDSLVKALDRAGVGYTRLAGSARRGDENAYAAASSLLLDAEAATRRARRELVELRQSA